MAPLLGGREEAGGTGEVVPRVGGVGEGVPRVGGVGERVPRVGGVGEDAAPRGTGDIGDLIGANGFPSLPCPNGLPVLGSTLKTWGPVGWVTPCVIVTAPLVGLGSWPAARNLSIMPTSLALRPGGPVAAPAPCASPGAAVGEAAVALSDEDPVVVVGGVAGVVLGVAVTVEGDDLVDVVGGDVVRPSEV